MGIDITSEVRKEAVASIERYFLESRDQKIGNIAAAELLAFFVEEVGPVIYNMAVAKVQERLQMRVMEIDMEVTEDAFQYWRKREQAKKRR